ncbi:family 20 glycosylhydrolase [Cohnella soli]|uniref:Family 20 glycosylhydrolase n=1 Tax=Cohnella soli TaxID=425005 RepID=A0ABW0I4J8_9BACL
MTQLELRFAGVLDEVRRGIELVCSEIGVKVSDSGMEVELIRSSTNSDLIVEYDGVQAMISYASPHHLYRAIGLLAEAMKTGERFELSEQPQFDTVGFMLDCSRNAVPTVGSVKELLRRMAVMGMNMVMLYTEDTYAVEKEPYFGYMRGRYSSEELKELDTYAASLGIEMVPCIQTLAHLDTFLKWESASRLRDSQDVLLVGNDATYEFIDRLVSEASRTFRSRRIHIGMDEAGNLGRGRSLDLNGYKEPAALMDAHLAKVAEIVESYGLQPMIWSDMYFRNASATHDYYDTEVSFDARDAARVPSGTQLVYWDYYHYEQKVYESMISKHRQLGTTPLFAGGIWTWLGMCTHYERTFKCTNAALQACKQEGVREVFATAWGDNGAENNLWTVLPGLQLFAEHAYAKQWDEAKYRSRTALCTGIPYEDFATIERLDDVPGLLTKQRDISNTSKYLLWQDVLLGLFDKHIEGLDVSTHYRNLKERYTELAANGPQAKRIFEVPARISAVLSSKADLGIRLKKLYDAGNRPALETMARTELPTLLLQIDELRIAHRQQWMSTNKPFGWEVLDLRYGGLTARIKTAKDRIEDFLSEKIAHIEELEEERLFFDDREHSGTQTDYYTTYHLIASPNKVT